MHRWASLLAVLVGADALAGNRTHPKASYGNIPEHCELAVVGAGYGGLYFAWRLAIDSGRIQASHVCIFEANGKIGGRVLTARDATLGVPLELGAARFPTSERLPADLINNKFMMRTTCFVRHCLENGCFNNGPLDDPCIQVSNEYANSVFALPLEAMLTQLTSQGARIFYGTPVSGIIPPLGGTGARLTFVTDPSVLSADMVLFNAQIESFHNLVPTSLIFPPGGGSEEANACFRCSSGSEYVKAFVVYEDAWWMSQLGLITGSFSWGESAAPLSGRYDASSVKCEEGSGNDGVPIYADYPVPHGKCSGAVQIFYGVASSATFYSQAATNANDTLTTVDRNSPFAFMLDEVHHSMLSAHKKALEDAGIDSSSLAPPLALYIGSWTRAGPYVKGLCRCECIDDLEKMKHTRKPNPGHKVFVTNTDFANSRTVYYAAASLLGAEKILQAELELPAPMWLDAAYYQKEIIDVP